MKLKDAIGAFAVIAMSTSAAFAQPPQGPPGGGGRSPRGQQGEDGGRRGPSPRGQQGEDGGRRGPPPRGQFGDDEEQGHRGPPPGGHDQEQGHRGPPSGGDGQFILAALDVDQDHELSKAEIKNAVRVLRSLDANGDGKLTREDDRSNRGGHGGPPERGGHGGHGGRGGPPGGHGQAHVESGGDSETDEANGFADRLIAFDKDGDGSIAKSELPSRMQRLMDNIDLDGDDVIDASELEKLRSASPSTDGGHARGGHGGPGGRGGPGGERGPEQMINHAFEFDKDGDGQLSRDELTAFAESMGQHGGPPRGRPE